MKQELENKLIKVEDTNLNTSSLKILNLLFDCKSYLVACLKPVRQQNIIYHILFVTQLQMREQKRNTVFQTVSKHIEADWKMEQT